MRRSWLKRGIDRVLRPFGYALIRSSEYWTLQEVSARLEREASDYYQVLMAQQSIMAALRDMEPEFQAIYDVVKPYTMTSVERLYALYKAVEYIVKARIPGDLLECGVWRGGSMMLVARTLLQLGETSRTLRLFDTYEGHPKPDRAKDIDLWGHAAYDDWKRFRNKDGSSDWARVSIEDVAKNLASTGYPVDRVALIKGMIEQTATAHTPERLALLRLDTDWYASARVGLETFWPRLSPRGVLIVDDYGHYKGQKQAVDEYFATTPVLLHRIDYSCRTVIRPG